MAEVRNISRVATTMNASDGSSVQINAGYHGKVEDKFLWHYDPASIHVVQAAKPATPTVTSAPVVAKAAPVEEAVEVQVEEASTTASSLPSFRGSNYEKRK